MEIKPYFVVIASSFEEAASFIEASVMSQTTRQGAARALIQIPKDRFNEKATEDDIEGYNLKEGTLKYVEKNSGHVFFLDPDKNGLDIAAWEKPLVIEI